MPPRDAAEQDLALANQAAMAAAMGGEAATPRQETPTPEGGRDGERQAGGRRERGERGGERGGRRSERRGERPEGQSAGAEASAGSLAAEIAPPAAAALDEAAQLQASALAPVQIEQGSQAGEEPRQPRERRSRDRYGRDRRERGENGERSESAANAMPNQAPAEQERAPVATEFVAPVAAPAAAYTAPVQVLAPESAPAPAAETTALPKVQAYELPLQDLARVAQTSGLQWINSDAAKIAEVHAAIAAEVKPVHVPRERPPVVVSSEAPLVLVETKRDLKTMPLPFETPLV